MSTWQFKLQPASFRGVYFKVSDDEATFGRRTTTYEYPNRDTPFTDDMGRTARRYAVSAYVIGNDYMAQRDRLLTELEKGGSGTLIHPFYGSLTVHVDREIKVHHSRENGGMCELSLQFVESGMLSYPTAGAATAQKVEEAADEADDSFAARFLEKFDLTGPDWISDGVIQKVSETLDTVIKVFEGVDKAISTAARVLQGDLSALFPPPSQGDAIITQTKAVWAAGKSIYFDTTSAISAIESLKFISGDESMAPEGVWSTLSETEKQTASCTNAYLQLLRCTAVTQSARQLARLPALPVYSQRNASRTSQVIHPALSETFTRPDKTTIAVAIVSGGNLMPATYDQLTQQRISYNRLFDRESCRIDGDLPFLRLEDLRQAVSLDIRKRLQQTAKTVTRTPPDVLPAVVLASDWYDDASRCDEIIALNALPHPGFVPAETLRVSSE